MVIKRGRILRPHPLCWEYVKSVKQYLEYRAYLHDYYEARRAEDAFFSYRFMARKVGMDHGYLVKLLQQKVHLAEGHLGKFIGFCGLKGRDEDYFRTLVHFNKSKNPDQTAILFEKLMNLAGVEAHPVEKDQFEYYSAWYHSAIRALLGHMKYDGEAGVLAKALNPPVPERQVVESVQLLERLKLVRKDEEGLYKPTEALITTGGNLQAAAVRQFQHEMIRLADEALERHPKDQRDISSVTISIEASDLGEVRSRIAALRQSLMSLASMSASADSVFQLNVQLFPLSRIKKP